MMGGHDVVDRSGSPLSTGALLFSCALTAGTSPGIYGIGAPGPGFVENVVSY